MMQYRSLILSSILSYKQRSMLYDIHKLYNIYPRHRKLVLGVFDQIFGSTQTSLNWKLLISAVETRNILSSQ